MSRLQGKKIIVTRQAKQAKSLIKLIEGEGGVPILVPLIRTHCISSEFKPRPTSFEWIFFTSVNGVNCFFKQNKIEAGEKIAVVGEKTRQAVLNYHERVEFMPSSYHADTMVKEFFEQYPAADNFLVVRGNIARPTLLEAFKKYKRNYEAITVYKTEKNSQMQGKLIHILQEKDVDAITFTSPSTVEAFVSFVKHSSVYEKALQMRVAAIGTTTAKALHSHGFKQISTPKKFTVEAMVEQLIASF